MCPQDQDEAKTKVFLKLAVLTKGYTFFTKHSNRVRASRVSRIRLRVHIGISRLRVSVSLSTDRVRVICWTFWH